MAYAVLADRFFLLFPAIYRAFLRLALQIGSFALSGSLRHCYWGAFRHKILFQHGSKINGFFLTLFMLTGKVRKIYTTSKKSSIYVV